MGLIYIYSSLDEKHKTEKANGKIKVLYPELDFNRHIILVGGNKVNSDYIVKENDVVFIRAIPADPVTAISVTGAIISVVAGIVAGVSLYKANLQAEEAQNALKNSKSNSENKLPFLKGASNRSAQGQSFPYFIGEHYFTPYRLAPKYYEVSGINGCNEYVYLILEAGFNPLIIKKLSLGNIPIFNNAEGIEATEGIFNFAEGTYFDEENVIEIRQSNEFQTSAFSKKIVSDYYNTIIENKFGTASADIVPVVKQLQENTKAVDICILFDKLRKYDSDTGAYVPQSVRIAAYWSNKENPDPATESDWNLLTGNNTFRQLKALVETTKTANYSCSFVATHQLNESAIKAELINSVSSWVRKSGDTGNPSAYTIENIRNISSSYVIKTETVDTATGGTFKHKNYKYTCNFSYFWQALDYGENYSDIFNYNSDEQMRFIAHKEFTAAEAYGKQITIKLVRTTPSAENNSNENCFLYFVNSEIYDVNKSSDSALVTCSPLEEDARNKCCRIGVKMKATASNENLTDSFNIIAAGMARTWQTVEDEDGNESKVWIPTKQLTRNPASWLLEVLTTNAHPHSKFDDSEIDLDSFGALYEYCETNNFYSDGVITEGKKKKDIVESLLNICNASLIYNSDGLLEIAIDKAEQNPVALLNTQNVIDVTVSKDFTRKSNCRKITFVNRDSWTEETVYYNKNGTAEHSASDTITELAPEFITTYEHAVKYARRNIAVSYLQPKELTVTVGKEGAYYPLYSCVDVQLPQLKKGLVSSVISGIKYTNGLITGITIADNVYFNSNYSYGIIINCISSTGRGLFTAGVTQGSNSRELVFTDSIDPEELNVMFEIGNNISFGILDSENEFELVRSRMKIIGISADNNSYKLKLKEYNSAIYEEGTIPAYESTVTPEPETKKGIDLTVKTTDLTEAVVNIQKETDSQIKVLEKKIDVSNKYILDLSPEYQILSVNSSGIPFSQDDLKIEVNLYYETEKLSDVTYTATVDDVEGIGSWNDNVFILPVSAITKDNTVIKFTAQYEEVTRSANVIERTNTATIAKLYAEASWIQYDFELTDNAVKVTTEGEIIPASISAEKIKRTAEGQSETTYGHLTAIIDEGNEYTVGEYEKDNGAGYDSQFEYKKKMKPFYMTINGNTICKDNSVLISYYRAK